MEYVFDYGSLLKKSEAKHKLRPSQFGNVTGGIQQRLKLSIQNRKSTRFLAHDNARDLEICTTALPPPKSEAQIKIEHRKQQLEKWKEEKDLKKKQEAARKKKPFLAGIPKNPFSFVPPPPPPPKPSTSGPITRSQTRCTTKPKAKSPVKSHQKAGNTQSSFAPNNATFKPPECINLDKLPKLAPVSRSKKRLATIQWSFDPVVPTKNNEKPIQTRSTRQNVTEKKNTKPVAMETRSARGRITKRPSPKKVAKYTLTSNSSGSDIEQKKESKLASRIQTPGAKKNLNKQKDITPKLLNLESTSSETVSGGESDTPSRRKSAKKVLRSEDSQSNYGNINRKSLTSEDNQSGSENSSIPSSDEKSMAKVDMRNRRTLANHFSFPSFASDSDKKSSDVEKSPVVVLRRSLPCTPAVKVIPRSESGSEEKLRSPKADVLTPEQKQSAEKSPFVTLSRGKENIQKEMKWRIREGLWDEDMESIEYFRNKLSMEITRMTELCEIWDKISTQTVLPEAVQEAVLSAIGQARLLMSSKLQQFGGLVEKCASPEPGSALITPADLQGFWDMVYIQVLDVDIRFQKLEETRARNWSEDEPKAANTRREGGANAKPAQGAAAGGAKAKGPRGAGGAKPKRGNSRIKEMIAAARKAMKDKQGQNSSEDSSPISEPSSSEEKTFEAGFFCVRSPVRSPARPSPATPAGNLLKAVLSSEANKASASKQLTPFAMLRASYIGKHADCDGLAPLPQTPQQLTPINLFATPARSILKSANKQPEKSDKKSAKTVLFNDSSEESDLNQSCIRDSAISGINILEKTLSTENENTEQKIQEKENKRVLRSTRLSERKSLQNISNIEDTTDVKILRSSAKKNKNTKEIPVTENVTPVVTEKKSSNRRTSKKSTGKKSRKADISLSEKRKQFQRQEEMEESDETNNTEAIVSPHQFEETTTTNNHSVRTNKVLQELETVVVKEPPIPNQSEENLSTSTNNTKNKALINLETSVEKLESESDPLEEPTNQEIEESQPTTLTTNHLKESTSNKKQSSRRNKTVKELKTSGIEEPQPTTPTTNQLKESTSNKKQSGRRNKALKELETSVIEDPQPTTPTTNQLEESRNNRSGIDEQQLFYYEPRSRRSTRRISPNSRVNNNNC